MATSALQPTVTPPPVEVLCAGCGAFLEVEPGLKEFACPDCHMAQALPHELMPRKRKALPVTHTVDLTKIQLPCGTCGVLLNIPYGLSRFVCPQCRYEMAIDKEQLKAYLSGAPSSEAMPSTPYGVRLPLVVDVKPQIQFPSYVEILAEVKQLADEATKPIIEKMEEMTKSHQEMVEKMKEKVEETKAMHQLLLAQDNTRAVHPAVIGGHAGEDWLHLG